MMYDFPATKPVSATIKLSGGLLELTAEERDSVAVTVEPFGDSEAGRDAAARTRVDLKGDRLVITAPDSTGWIFRRGARLHVTVRLPADSSLNFTAASADVRCTGRLADVTAGTASGDITVDKTTGHSVAKSASGDVRLGFVGGHARVNTTSGDAHLEHVVGDIGATSASGDIIIDAADASVHATTASGAVRIGSARHGSVKAHSTSGDVTIGIVTGTVVWLDLTTLSGNTTSDLDVAAGPPATESHLRLQVRTLSGDIEIHRTPNMEKAAQPAARPQDSG